MMNGETRATERGAPGETMEGKRASREAKGTKAKGKARRQTEKKTEGEQEGSQKRINPR
jgi:hypothetical protein